MHTLRHPLIWAAGIIFLCGCDPKSLPADDTEIADAPTANAGPLVTNNRDCSDTAVYRFDAVSPEGTDSRRIFIDFANGFSGVVTRGSLATDSHFGGPVTDCSTEQTRCVDAIQLAFAWPKDEAQTSFPMGEAKCQLARAGDVSNVSCFVGKELDLRYRVVGRAIDRIEFFYPGYPEYSDAVFESVDEPLPLCKL